MISTTFTPATMRQPLNLLLRLPGAYALHRLVFFLATCVLIWVAPIFAAPDISVSVHYDRPAYAPGDSVLVGLELSIPRNWYLYSNPLGMGTGRALSVALEPVTGVRWHGVFLSAARKYEPDLGEWVWAHRKSAWIFLKGVVGKAETAPVRTSVRIQGLMCDRSCVEVDKKVVVTVVPDKRLTSASTPGESSLRMRLAGARPIAPIELTSVQTVSSPLKTAPPASAIKPGRAKAGKPTPGVSSASYTALSAAEDFSVQDDTVGVELIDDPLPAWDYTPQERQIKYNLWLALLFAFVAGVLLNVMPCVLPVLGIKVLSFSQGQGQGRRAAVLRSLVFSAGMITVFIALATLGAFASFSWGEQFRDRNALVVIIALIVFFALGLFDFYTMLVPAVVGNASRRLAHTRAGDFFRGVLATILATPCSGPFLGATLAWALRQSTLTIYLVFIAVGVGMASPYVLFTTSRRLMKLVPGPGPWMNDFKHLMGLFLLGVAIFLMIGLPSEMVIATLLLCLFVVLAVGFFGRFAGAKAGIEHTILIGAVALFIAGGGGWFAFGVLPRYLSHDRAKESAGAATWVPFSAQALFDAHAQGRSVAIDFTAAWCMNCQYNKLAVLNNPEIDSLLVARGVLAMRADLTVGDEQIESLMTFLGSESVPFFALFAGDDPFNPAIMRDVLRKGHVREALLRLPVR